MRLQPQSVQYLFRIGIGSKRHACSIFHEKDAGNLIGPLKVLGTGSDLSAVGEQAIVLNLEPNLM